MESPGIDQTSYENPSFSRKLIGKPDLALSLLFRCPNLVLIKPLGAPKKDFMRTIPHKTAFIGSGSPAVEAVRVGMKFNLENAYARGKNMNSGSNEKVSYFQGERGLD